MLRAVGKADADSEMNASTANLKLTFSLVCRAHKQIGRHKEQQHTKHGRQAQEKYEAGKSTRAREADQRCVVPPNTRHSPPVSSETRLLNISNAASNKQMPRSSNTLQFLCFNSLRFSLIKRSNSSSSSRSLSLTVSTIHASSGSTASVPCPSKPSYDVFSDSLFKFRVRNCRQINKSAAILAAREAAFS